MKSPFPYFGGKSRIADQVWRRFGDVTNFVEPFFGSGACLLARPTPFGGVETINDADGMVANFWRALQADPDAVAFHADWPVNECDLHARHSWLVGRKELLVERLSGDPEFADVKAAGWWCWGLCCWIGGGFCSGNGPWQSVEVNGVRQLVHLGNSGQGVKRKLVHLGNAGRGVNRQLVRLGDAGRGVNRKRVHLGNAGQGLYSWFAELAERLRHVRVCCGDWSRVTSPTVTEGHGVAAIFLDPPYSDTANRDSDIYSVDSESVAHDVREWAIEQGKNPRLRIALCSYGEYPLAAGWQRVKWKASGGYGSQGNGSGRENARREVVDFSPHCIAPEQDLFSSLEHEEALT